METEHEFIADAQRIRDHQVAQQGANYEPDPAIQAGIDQAMQDAASGPEPGSQQPGFMGLGGLSKAEVDAQKDEIVQRQNAASI